MFHVPNTGDNYYVILANAGAGIQKIYIYNGDLSTGGTLLCDYTNNSTDFKFESIEILSFNAGASFKILIGCSPTATMSSANLFYELTQSCTLSPVPSAAPIFDGLPLDLVENTDQLFATDSHKLTPHGMRRLEDFFRSAGAFGYAVYGHTDSRASDEYNMRLSQRRAKAVADVGYPCVVKPVMSSSGKGQSLLRSDADLQAPATHGARHYPGERRIVIHQQQVRLFFTLLLQLVGHLCIPRIGHDQDQARTEPCGRRSSVSVPPSS